MGYKKLSIENNLKSKSLARLGFVTSPTKKAKKGRQHEVTLSQLRDKLRAPLQGSQNDFEQEEKKKGFMRFISRKPSVQPNFAMIRFSKRFEFYCDEGKSELSLKNFKRLIKHVNEAVTDDIVKKIFYVVDSNHDGSISYDEFVSYFSLTREAILQLAQDIRDEVVYIEKTKGLKYAFKKLANRDTNILTIESLEMFAMSTMEKCLTPGELSSLVTIIGDSYSTFKKFIRKDVEYSQSSFVLEVAVVQNKSKLELQDFEKVGPLGKSVSLYTKKRPNTMSKNNNQDSECVKCLVGMEVAMTNQDAGMVVNGFHCMEVPVQKSRYLWTRVEKNNNSTVDAIIDVAITTGNVHDRKSSLWSPPFHAYKRVPAEFTVSKNVSSFLWYKKKDEGYVREKAHVDVDQAETTEARIKAVIRERIADTFPEKGGDFFDAEKILPANCDYLTQRTFVSMLEKLGLNLPSRDLAHIFSTLDVDGSKRIHVEDVLDYFELSEPQLDQVLCQVKKMLRQAKSRGETLFSIFSRLDVDSDGKLSPQEFLVLLNEVGVSVTKQELQRVVDHIDSDGSGFVDMSEFQTFVNSKDKSWKHKMSLLGFKTKNAAQQFHFHCVALANCNQATGRLDAGLNVEYMWKTLVKAQENQSVLHSTTIKAFLKQKGCELRKQTVEAMAGAIESRFQELGGIKYTTLVTFVKDYETHSSKTSGGAAQMGKETILNVCTQLRSDLSDLAIKLGNKPESVYGFVVNSQSRSVSCSKFFRGMVKHGLVPSTSSSRDQKEIMLLFDKDGDSKVCSQDIVRFIEESNWSDSDQLSSEESSDEDNDSEKRIGKHSKTKAAVWWLEQEGKDNEELEVLFESDMKRKWAKYLGDSEQSPINIGVIRSSVEDAARRFGEPLNLRRRLTNSSGSTTISTKDFKKVLEKIDLRIPASEHQALQQLLTTSNSKQVNCDAFLKLVEQSSEIKSHDFTHLHSRLVKEFHGAEYMHILQGFDGTGTGVVSKDDFFRAMKLLDIVIPGGDWKALKPQISTSDGRIDYYMLDQVLTSPPRHSHQVAAVGGSIVGARKLQKMVFQRLQKKLMASCEPFDFVTLFEHLDEKGNGYILEKDFSSILQNFFDSLDFRISGPDLQFIGSLYHRRSKSTDIVWIDYIRFCEALNDNQFVDEELLLQRISNMIHSESSMSQVQQLFRLSDSSGFGFISRFNLRHILQTSLNFHLSESELIHLMHACDSQSNGMVDYTQLLNMLSIQVNEAVPTAPMVDFVKKRILRLATEDKYLDARKLWCFFSDDDTMNVEKFKGFLSHIGYFLRTSENVTASTISSVKCYVDAFEEDWDELSYRLWDHICISDSKHYSYQGNHMKLQEFKDIIKQNKFPISRENEDAIFERFSAKNVFRFNDFLEFIQRRAMNI